MRENIYSRACRLLSSGQNIIFVRTIRRSGSTPRDVGSMCIVTEDEKLIGTVGGGALEFKVQQKAKDLFKTKKSFVYRFQLSNEDLAKNGMICGGNVDLYLEPLFYENKSTLSFFKAVHDQILSNEPGVIITKIQDDIPSTDTKTRMLLKEGRPFIGSIKGIDPDQVDFDKALQYDLVTLENDISDLFFERLSLTPMVFIFGAGHVSVFVSKVAKMVGFNITIIDDRPKFANKQNFPDADDILVCDFGQAFDHLSIFENSYILIITRGHLHDKTVLEKALSTNASYIGMIGSIQKRNLIYKDLLKKGFAKNELEQVRSPVGLDIRAETPEEIAVSIVGELIKKRAPKKAPKKLIL